MLQGRYISHQALAAHGGNERITMITSYRPRDPCIAHTSVLTTIRPISKLSEVYRQWTRYRVDVLKGQLDELVKFVDDKHHDGEYADKDHIKKLLACSIEWLTVTNDELR